MKFIKDGEYEGLWYGLVGDKKEYVSVVGTYGFPTFPIVRIQTGERIGECFAIEWETGKIVANI